MAGGVPNTASGVQTIDALLGSLHWGNLNLTYNFPTSAAYYDPSTYFTAGNGGAPTFDFSTFAPVTPSLAAAIEKAIATELMAVSLLNYTKTTATDPAADSSFARASLYNDPDTGTVRGGVGYYPGLVDRGGDAWFNADLARFNNVQPGNHAYFNVLHELGHTVGLKHGHETQGGPQGIAVTLPAETDSMEYSVMTYRRYVGGPDVPVNDVQADSWPQSLMMYDIAAIQYMYGADFTTNSGNTIYTFSTTTGEMFVNGVGQGAPSGNRIFRTVWDGGGNDTYDLSNYTSNLEIDLTPGHSSNFHSGQLAKLSIANNIFASGNLYNALQYDNGSGPDARSLIENAVGGSGNDTIIGNAAANRLTGGAGEDTLRGGLGNDTLIGGTGNDALFGEEGADTLRGEAGNDKLSGGAGNDILTGGAGDDSLSGGAGNDTLGGDAGRDLITGGAGNDHLYGGAGSDTFRFVAKESAFGNDIIHDWQDGRSLDQDVISFVGFDITFEDLTINYVNGNAQVYVTPVFGAPQNVILIEHVAPGTLAANDFLFV